MVASHTCLSFATYLIPPSFAETGNSILFQRPFFRLVIQGQAWVAIFLVLLGFVNALKPLQLARRGATADALASLSTGAFRRKWRLVFPAALMTILAWLLCQFGGFQLGRRVDAYWLRATSPQPSSSLGAAVVDLIREIAGTWMYGENAYDQPQWALLPLFRGSLYVFMTLLALVNTTPLFRLCAQMVLYTYSWITLDGTFGNIAKPNTTLIIYYRYCGYEYFRWHDTSRTIVLQPNVAAATPDLQIPTLRPRHPRPLHLLVPRSIRRPNRMVFAACIACRNHLPKRCQRQPLLRQPWGADDLLWGNAFTLDATDALPPPAAMAGVNQLPTISRPWTANAICPGLSSVSAHVNWL